MRKILFNLLIVTAFAVAVHIGLGAAYGGTPPEMKVSLSFVDQDDNPIDKDVFVLGQDSRIAVYLQYVGQDSLVASEIFARKRFHLCLLFTYVGPDGKEKLITAENREDAGDPPPPRVKLVDGQFLQMELVEVFAGWVWKVAFNVEDHYTLPGAGNYSVEAVIPITTYPGWALQTIKDKKYAQITDADWVDPIGSRSISFSIVTDADGDGYCFPVAHGSCQHDQAADCNDNDTHVNPGATEIEGNGIDDDCNPETADVTEIPPGNILVKVDKHIVGRGSHPGSTKVPLDGIEVRVIDKSLNSCCMQYFGVSWHYYESIWLSSDNLDSECCKRQASGFTDAGVVTLSVPPGDYIIIALYETDGSYYDNDPKVYSDDEVFMGVSAGGVESGQTIQKYLQVIEKASGKKGPAKYTKKTGSDLLIIEPEYVEWDGTEEYYPIIFESIGDWTVTTFVAPPEGFVADHDSLTEEVNTELEAVQFTLTDVGSSWKDTKVKHKIKHKGKSETINSKIDVMLSKKLAKKKKKSRYGDGFNPWKKENKEK